MLQQMLPILINSILSLFHQFKNTGKKCKLRQVNVRVPTEMNGLMDVCSLTELKMKSLKNAEKHGLIWSYMINTKLM
jgi:hypothetical protein